MDPFQDDFRDKEALELEVNRVGGLGAYNKQRMSLVDGLD